MSNSSLRMAATQWIILASILFSSHVVLSSHFRGAIFQWRPVTNDAESFDGTIEITQRLAWRRNYMDQDNDTLFDCTEADTNTTKLFGENGVLVCRTGCTGVIGSVQVYCTDFSIQEDWFSGTRTYTHDLGEGVTSFEASYQGKSWIDLRVGGHSPHWEVRVKGNLAPRSDNGCINTSPVTSITPVVRLQYNCTHTIKIPVQDADQDIVRCRWAKRSLHECDDACKVVPGATIDQDACELNWNADHSTGFYAVTIQVEDFMTSSDTTPMSSVPIQFLLNVFHSEESCSGGIRPSLIPGVTPPDGSCIPIHPGETYNAAIIASSGDESVSITEFRTISPLGLTSSAVTQSQFNSTHYYSNITWTPSQSQYGEPSQFCFSALNSEEFETEQFCITLYAGVTGPKALSVTPTGIFRPNDSTVWSVTFDQNIARPNSSRYIHFYETSSGMNVYNFDVTSPAATYNADRTLTFSFDYSFTIGIDYYILLDDGIALGSQFCGEESIGVTNTSFWTFTSEPPVPTNIDVQAVVGDPFSLFVSWDAPSVPNGVYIVNYSVHCLHSQTGQESNDTVEGDRLNATIAGLSPFSNYGCYVSVNPSIGKGGRSNSIFQQTNEYIPSDPPAGLQVSTVTTTSVYLSWSPPLTPNGIIVTYTVLVEEVDSQLNTTITVGAVSSTTVEDLLPNREYNFRVAASTSVGMGPYGVIAARTQEESPSGSPQMFDGTAISSHSITFSWTEPPEDQQNGEITGYTLNITEAGTGVTMQQTVPSSQTTLTVTSLQPFTSYFCSVAASTSVGTGPFSAPITVTTLEASPSMPPANLIGTAQDSTTILLSWDPPSGNHNGIIREYRVNITEVETGIVTQLVSATTDLTVVNLHPDYTYQWIVTAFTVDDGPFSDPSVVKTPEDVPSGSPMVTSTPLDSHSIFLNWTLLPPEERNGEITGYTLNISEVGTGVIMQMTVLSPQTNLTVTSLQPFTSYTVLVAASTSVGTGPFSAPITVTTLEASPSMPPANLTGSAQDSTTILLSWDPPSGDHNGIIREYRVNITEINTGIVTQLVSATTDLTVDNLHPDYTYQWIVTAFTVDEGPFSNPSIVKTPEDVPSGSPMVIASALLDSHSIFLSLTLPPPEERNGEIIGYIVRITNTDTGEVQQFVTDLVPNKTFDIPRPNTVYSVEIATYNVAGTGSFSTAFYIQTLEDIPGAPVEVKATIRDSSSIRLTWSLPTNPNGELVGYLVYYHGYNIKGDTVVISDGPHSVSVSADQTSNLFENLNGGLSYSFVVQARTAVGSGANSTAATVDLSLANVVCVCGPNISIGIVLAIVGWSLLIVLLIIVTTRKAKAAKVEV